jgi:imidazolonepropionase-like amidohydrolase
MTPADRPRVTAFVDVHVVPMDRNRILDGQTVLVEGEQVSAMGATGSVRVPAGAHMIDGRAKYLMPGLADMHVHLPRPDSTEREVDNYLRLNLARGVTTLRSMRGHPAHLRMRERILRGEVLGPTLYLSAPPIVLDSAADIASAMVRIKGARSEGYDFIKWLAGQDAVAYDSLMAQAHEQGLKVAGHGPPSGIAGAIRARQASIEHVDPYLKVYQQDQATFLELIKAQAQAGIFICPDVYWYVIDYKRDPIAHLESDPALRYISPALVSKWVMDYQAEDGPPRTGDPAALLQQQRRQEDMEAVLQILKALHDAGVQLLVSPGDGDFIVPGFSMAQELRIFVQVGIPTYEALRAATYNAAAFFDQTQAWGSVAPGLRADLILLDDNPLWDINAIEKLAGVMVRGQWFSHVDIQDWLKSIAERIGKPNTVLPDQP